MMKATQAQFAYLHGGWRHAAAAITLAALMALPEVAFAVGGRDSGVDCDAPNVICGQREEGDIAAGGLGPGHGGGYTAPGAVPGAGAGTVTPPPKLVQNRCAKTAQNTQTRGTDDSLKRQQAAGEAVRAYVRSLNLTLFNAEVFRGQQIEVVYSDGSRQIWTIDAIAGGAAMNAVYSTPVTPVIMPATRAEGEAAAASCVSA